MAKYGKKVGMLPGDHEYAKNWSALFKPAWEGRRQVVSNNPMSYNKAADFYSGVSRVLAEKPDVLFIGGPSEPTALVAKQARELGFKGGFLIMDQAKLDEMAKVVGRPGALEGSIGVLPVSYDDRAGIEGLCRALSQGQRCRQGPEHRVFLQLRAVHALAGAMKLAGTDDRRHGHPRQDRRCAHPAAREDQCRLLQGRGRRRRHHRRPAGGDSGWREGQAGELERVDEVTGVDRRRKRPAHRARVIREIDPRAARAMVRSGVVAQSHSGAQ
jgi:hypothetical protein